MNKLDPSSEKIIFDNIDNNLLACILSYLSPSLLIDQNPL